MKQFLLFAATVLVTLGTISQAQAKKPEDQEFRRVIVTLTSGEKVDGYLQRSWHAESSVLKKENYSFKLAKTPDDKEPVKYTADEVESIEYVEKTEAHPDGIRWEALDIASPGLKDRYRTFRRLVCHYLLVEDMDNRAGRQYRPPGVEDRIRHPFPRRSRPDRLSVYVGQHHAGGKTASRIAEVLQNMVQRLRRQGAQKRG